MFTSQRYCHNVKDTNGNGEIVFALGGFHIARVFTFMRGFNLYSNALLTKWNILTLITLGVIQNFFLLCMTLGVIFFITERFQTSKHVKWVLVEY